MSEVWDSGFLPPGVTASSVTPLTGGAAHSAWLVRLADGRSVVVKGGQAVADSLFAAEAAGLATLRAAGLRTPDVLHLGAKSLVLAALNPALPAAGRFWEDLGRLVAGLHAHTGPRYGWDQDGWLGLLRQENAWDDDGHRFFSQRRILRYLREPNTALALDAADLTAIEKLCDRLQALVPDTPAVLTHGDLWHGNVVSDRDERPVFIDPAVSWMWAEVDLSMMYCSGGGVPARFFDAYHEVSPPPAPDWEARMELLNLRELLSVVAHFGPAGDYPQRIRRVIKRFG